ncbi:MAG: hypothetical protein F9K25_18560 [Candidatus Contendobacter sp.]|nr:MAG: hypothetical protein F9K25_18560 [Candidatus Contendobacter sp.]
MSNNDSTLGKSSVDSGVSIFRAREALEEARHLLDTLANSVGDQDSCGCYGDFLLVRHVQNIIRTAESDLRHCQPRREE